MSNIWSKPTSSDQANCRAGGRRHYNSWRQTCAAVRRVKVSRLLRRFSAEYARLGIAGINQWGIQARIARKLGVSQATISRDIALLEQEWRTHHYANNLP